MSKRYQRPTFICYTDKRGEHRWRLEANYRVVADSGESFTRRTGAVRSAKRMAAWVVRSIIVAGYR